jgi:ethanolamine utilization protein EutP (predicted NTPase)
MVLLGSSAAGKTALLSRLLGGEAYDAPRMTVIVSPWPSCELPLGDRETAVIDLPGEPTPGDMLQTLSELEVAVALVVIDPMRATSVPTDLARWSAMLSAVRQDRPPQKIVVWSHADLASAQTLEAVADLPRGYNFDGSFTTSAKDGTGIQQLRTAVIDIFARKQDERDADEQVVVAVRALAERLCELVAKHHHVLREIEWRDLERIVASALERIGFSVELTPPARDGGEDVVATCLVEKERKVFYIEIKHWVNGDRPGPKHVAEFIEINARDRTDGGLFLSSSGYSGTVHSRLAEISRQHVRLGQREKIVHLCQQFVRRQHGLGLRSDPCLNCCLRKR